MKPYLLLTPGPLTTSETVKEAMMTDWCTWDTDYNLGIVQELRKDLVSIATKNTEDYTSVLLQGSGTYCVEAVLGATITPKDKLLICSNGAYGDRMGNIAEYYHLDYDMLAFEETEQVYFSSTKMKNSKPMRRANRKTTRKKANIINYIKKERQKRLSSNVCT